MSDNRNVYIVSVMASDRVGIIADVAAAVQRAGGNLEDVSQTVMRGYFTMIMLVELPSAASAADLEKRLKGMKNLEGAVVALVPYQPRPDGSPHAGGSMDNQYVLTASGPDQPGIVAQFSGYLKERGINIIDLSSCIDNGEYTMVWLVSIPPEINVRKLQAQLGIDLAPLAMKIGLRHQAIFRRTNEI